MKKEFKVFRCEKCEAIIISFNEESISERGMMCCDGKMQELVPNSVEASFEKHLPTYEIKGDLVLAKVNHVMEEEHYIEWIACVTETDHETRYFEPGMEAQAEFKYIPNSKLYAYCNKHGLWKSEVL